MILQVELLIQLTLLFTVKRGEESVPINWVRREICAAAYVRNRAEILELGRGPRSFFLLLLLLSLSLSVFLSK